VGIGHVSGRPAVFFDRDGVLNESFTGPDGVPRPPSGLAEFVLVDDADEACRELRSLGFLLIVVTNQPDVARGTQRRDVVEALHRQLREAVQLDDIRVCFHDDDDDCVCRKPKAGLLIAAAQEWGIDLASSFMIGDRWRDVEAGHRAGCVTVLVDRCSPQRLTLEPTIRVGSLLSAAHWIRGQVSNR
jgi:D-glycero-D-manno-heptose 1,7-bisphosphate phosphatase